MKAAASILLLIWGIVMVQPAFALFGGKPAYGACSKADVSVSPGTKEKTARSGCAKKKKVESGGCKKKCSKPTKPVSKGNCNTDGCNPSLGCSSGNFYTHHHAVISLITWFAQKQKVMVLNDNRILKSMSECWHPPEV